jgi:DnaJ-class molecular chaperone
MKREMNLREAFEMLDLDRKASIEDAKQAHKDLVNIWHPDRFSNNLRLKERAEENLKKINAAYDTVLSHLSSQGAEMRGTAKKRRGGAEPGTAQEAKGSRDKTEVMAESATRMVLTAWSYVSTAFRRFAEHLAEGAEEEKSSLGPNRQRRKGTGKKNGPG